MLSHLTRKSNEEQGKKKHARHKHDTHTTRTYRIRPSRFAVTAVVSAVPELAWRANRAL